MVIQDYPDLEYGLWKKLGRELLAATATGLLFPFGMWPSHRRTQRQAKQRTVVLVHGYLSNRSTLLPLGAYLRLRGRHQVLAFNYSSSAGIEQGAIQLKNFLRKHVRGGRIDLVCHSIGGLVSRVYLQQLGGARRVDRCITLGTPHRGTYNAYWVASRIGRELRPDSPLLERIRATQVFARRVSFTSIVAGSDNIVIPRIFSANEETVHIPELGHISMLFSAKIFRTVANRLTTDEHQV